MLYKHTISLIIDYLDAGLENLLNVAGTASVKMRFCLTGIVVFGGL